jgi:hypothetical protein
MRLETSVMVVVKSDRLTDCDCNSAVEISECGGEEGYVWGALEIDLSSELPYKH